MMTRDEHLEWATARALEYVNKNDIPNALASMASDLRKHDDLATHVGIDLGMMLLLSGNMRTSQDARKFIEGFN